MVEGTGGAHGRSRRSGGADDDVKDSRRDGFYYASIQLLT